MFSTRGSFRLWATKTGSETIETVNGFSEEWDTYTERSSVLPGTGGAALAAAMKMMASERAGLAKALAALRR